MRDYYREADGTTCSELHNKAEGFNKAVGLTYLTLDLKEGWFRLGQESSKPYACPHPAHCVGGVNVSELCSEVSRGVLCFDW